MFAKVNLVLWLCLTAVASARWLRPMQLPAEATIAKPTPLPLVIWHGLGDTYDADGMNQTAELAARVNPGTYVYNIRLSNDSDTDRRATFFGNLTEQLAQVCNDLATHPVLGRAAAVNAMGFSQGGNFLRGYVERCNVPPVRSLVTFGSQHGGISSFQKCGPTDWLCKAASGLLASNTWSDFVQGRLVPAQYYRDPEDLDSYLEHSNFLADINNERARKNATYKANLASLAKFAMIVFEDDTTVHPKESGWFAESNETAGTVTLLRDRQIYKDDWLGLKALDDKGALEFKTVPGAHMAISEEVFNATFKKYFSAGSNLDFSSVPDAGGKEVESGLDLEHSWVLVSPTQAGDTARSRPEIWLDL
ncbi:hypothetical protein MRB53_038662 [Persea americana]|nr:hypothetical protein MRB53_038662 [Persea americana]